MSPVRGWRRRVMLMADDRLVMAVISGDRRVDLEMPSVSCLSRHVESTCDIEKRGLAAAGRPRTTRNSPESTRESMSTSGSTRFEANP
jgi:hypothetical protein